MKEPGPAPPFTVFYSLNPGKGELFLTDQSAVIQIRANIVMGTWLFVSPLALAYPHPFGTAAWNAYLCGAAIALLGLLGIRRAEARYGWGGVAVAVWLMAGPLLQGYADQAVAVWNQLIMAMVAGGASLSAAAMAGTTPD